MNLHIEVDVAAIPRRYETDGDTGEVTAFNDDLRIMAVGQDAAEADVHFNSAVVSMAEHEIARGRGLPEIIQSRIYA
jgi:hypothetical protein